MKTGFEIFWLVGAVYYGFIIKDIPSMIGCLVISKLWQIDKKLDEPLTIVYNNQDKGEGNG